MVKILEKITAIFLIFIFAIQIPLCNAENVGGGNNVYDLTNIFTGKESNHDCNKYLNKKYDSKNHWDECFVCNKKYNIKEHSFITMGSDSCVWNNPGQTRICECGYNTKYKISHKTNYSKAVPYANYAHYYYCENCHSVNNSALESCKTADGKLIDCSTGGTCAKCGKSYSKGSHMLWQGYSGKSGTTYCTKCGTKFYSWEDMTWKQTGVNSIQTSIVITWWNKDIWNYTAEQVMNAFSYISPGMGNLGSYKITRQVKNNKVYLTADVTYPYQNCNYTYAAGEWAFGQWSTRVFGAQNRPIEFEAPKVTKSNIIYGPKSRNYATKASLQITCTDNWCYDPNVIKVRVLDKNKNVLSNWTATNRTGTGDNKIYSQTIDLVAEIRDKQTCYIQAVDSCGNLSEYPITVINLDSKAPVAQTPKIASNWTKEKTVTFSCTDMGVGDVSIAFNDQNNFEKADKNGDTYSKTYTFTGDVYGNATIMIYYKDGIGNISSKAYKISNLDNYAPTITDVTVTNIDSDEKSEWEFNITGNDQNKRLVSIDSNLNINGSGIIKYALSTDRTAPDINNYMSKLKSLNPGTYFVWAMDEAGNVGMYNNKISTNYNIKFDSNKPDSASTDVKYSMDKIEAIYNSSIELPENKFKLAGWKFIGWNTEPDGSGTSYQNKETVFNITDNNSITLYAQWSPLTSENDNIKMYINNNGLLYNLTEEQNEYIKDDLGNYYIVDESSCIYKELLTNNFASTKVASNKTKAYIKNNIKTAYYNLSTNDEYILTQENNNQIVHKFIGYSLYKYATKTETSNLIMNANEDYNLLDLLYLSNAVKNYNLENEPDSSRLKDKETEILEYKDELLNNAADLDERNIVLYAIYDDYPIIKTSDINITSKSFLNISTENDLQEAIIKSLNSAIINDKEDGNWNNGINNNIKVSIENINLYNIYDIIKQRYQNVDNKRISSTGSCSVNIEITDNAGNITTQIIDLWLIADNPLYIQGKPNSSYTRSISKEFIDKEPEDGGLMINSLWKTNQEYKNELTKTFEILEKDTGYDQVWKFSRDNVKEVQEYIQTNGLGNSEDIYALRIFYDTFKEKCKIQ